VREFEQRTGTEAGSTMRRQPEHLAWWSRTSRVRKSRWRC
jgi:hypothetical protein